MFFALPRRTAAFPGAILTDAEWFEGRRVMSLMQDPEGRGRAHFRTPHIMRGGQAWNGQQLAQA